MLKALRTGAQSTLIKFALFGLLILAMGGLAILDVQGMVGSSAANGEVATMKGARITAMELDRAVEGVLREKNIPRTLAASLDIPRQVLLREIDGRIFARGAHDAGLIVDDATAARTLRQMLKPLAAEQKISEKDALARVLASSGIGEAAFVGSLKQQTATETLIALLSSGAQAPAEIVKAAAAYESQTRTGAYFTLTAADAPAVTPPSDEDLRAHYQSIASRFARPATRAFKVLTLNAASLGLSRAASDEDLRRYYDERQAEYTTPETRKIAQAVARDEAAARALFDALKKGQSLAAAASGAKADVVKGRDYAQADLPAELAAPAFAAKAGEVVAPVQSALGWHVMKIESVAPGGVKPFAAVKADISKLISADKAAEALYEEATKIDDLLAGGKTIDEVAATYRLTPVSVPAVDAKGMDAQGKPALRGLPASDKILEHVFRLNAGEATPLIETPSGDFLIAGITAAAPAQDRPFEEARAEVLSDWTRQKQADALDRLATQTAARLKSGEAFEKVAASFRKTPATAKPLSRAADPSKTGLPRGFLPALFGLEKTGDAAAVPAGETVLVVKLAQTGTNGPAPAAETLRVALARAMQADIFEQYRAALMDAYKVKIDEEAVDALFRPREEDAP